MCHTGASTSASTAAASAAAPCAPQFKRSQAGWGVGCYKKGRLACCARLAEVADGPFLRAISKISGPPSPRFRYTEPARKPRASAASRETGGRDGPSRVRLYRETRASVVRVSAVKYAVPAPQLPSLPRYRTERVVLFTFITVCSHFVTLDIYPLTNLILVYRLASLQYVCGQPIHAETPRCC